MFTRRGFINGALSAGAGLAFAARDTQWAAAQTSAALIERNNAVIRRFKDARVVRVPSTAEIEALERRFCGTTVKVLCEEGKRLSAQDQDVGSYRYGIVNMSGPSWDQLYADYAEAERALRFEFA